MKKTVVLGASTNPARYSFLAINKLVDNNHPVVAIGRRAGTVRDIDFLLGTPEIDDIDTVTLYLNPTNQKPYYDYILSLQPKRVIFNPGTENEELIALLEKENIQAQETCTLVLLSTGQY